MTREELAALLAEHGENYDADGYHGCDCGLPCSAAEHADHLAAIVASASPSVAAVLEVLDHLGSLRVINESEAAVQAEYDRRIRAALDGGAA